jgi:hypothetical protein
MWPWSELKRLRWQLEWHEKRAEQFLFRYQLSEAIALKALRDLQAANKGIRRLVERLKRNKEGGAGRQG